MHAAVMERTSGQDAIAMSAAVADYTPTEPAKEKVKKADGPVTITLNRTKDILGDLGKLPLLERAAGARPSRQLIATAAYVVFWQGMPIIANDVSRHDAGFDVDTNAVTLVTAARSRRRPAAVEGRRRGEILDRIEQFLIAVPAKDAKVRA